MSPHRLVRKPPKIGRRKHGRIGVPPKANKVGLPLQQMWSYMTQFNQRGQVFSFSGPPDTAQNPTYDDVYTFYVPMRGPRKRDTSETTRNLQGVVVPWVLEPEYYDGAYTNDVKIEWKDGTGGSFATIFNRKVTTDDTVPAYGDRVERVRGVQLPGDTYQPNFTWSPAADGDWYLCSMRFEGVQVAALGIWDAPDKTLTSDQLWLRRKDFAPGQLIRGYNADADTFRSLGHMVRAIGDDNLTDDSISNMTSRCYFNTGHPVGIWSNSAAYVDLGGTASPASYKVVPKNIVGASSGVVKSFPAVVVTTSGAAGGTPGYIKYTANQSTDTWTLSITSDATAAMYTHSDGTTSDLDINYDYDDIGIEIYAPSGGEITLHSFALWSDYHAA